MYIVVFSLAWLVAIGLAAAASWLEYWTSRESSPCTPDNTGDLTHFRRGATIH
jgi:hypothetical protein